MSIEPKKFNEDEHPIRLESMDKEALKVLYRLRDEGHSGYLVGGGVRDLYLGKKPKDFDISTDARPGRLRKIFRSSRIIGRRFRLVQVCFRGNKIIEVSTLRSQSEYDIKKENEAEQVLPANNRFGTLEEDAFRRDLTINSLFYEIENNTIIDYVGGVQDLTDGIVRMVGEAGRRIIRDPVRMLRALRHAARNDFLIAEETWTAIVEHREKLNLCPPSRIRDELLRDLRGGAAAPWFKLAQKAELFTVLLPFYQPLLEDPVTGESLQVELAALLEVLDRLYREEQPLKIAEYLLLATLLLPWARMTFGLKDRRVSGTEYHQLSRRIRGELDQLLGARFNLKRAMNEGITALLVNLPTFMQYGNEQGKWPSWLRKKSYFQDGLQFFSLDREAGGGQCAPLDLFLDHSQVARLAIENDEQANSVINAASEAEEAAPVVAGSETIVQEAESEPRRSRGRAKFRPAFSSAEHGVFGLSSGKLDSAT